MAKSPDGNQRGTADGRINITYCAILAALPVLAALLPQLWVELMVPRDSIARYLGALAQPPAQLPTAVIPALYYYAVAAACTIGAACASLWYSASVLRDTLGDNGRVPRHIVVLLYVALLIAALCFLVGGAVDDSTARALFKGAGVSQIRPQLDWFGSGLVSAIPFKWDGRILGFATYLAFTVAAVTCAAAATSAPPPPAKAKPAPSQDGAAAARMTIVRTSLFFATAVLLASMVTAKLRFDVGLAAIGAPAKDAAPSAAYVTYQTVANALTTYWSVVLSLSLTALYVPPSVALYPPYLWEKGQTDGVDWLALNKENLTRGLRMIAILSPPIIAEVIKGFTG